MNSIKLGGGSWTCEKCKKTIQGTSIHHECVSISSDVKLESSPKTVKELAEEAWEGCHGCTKSDEIMWTNGWRAGYNRAKPSVEDLHRIWEAAKEYLITSGSSVTFEELIERLKL